MQDVIRREITIDAPQEKVYEAIADPKKIVKWFPDSVEGNFEVGERPILDFGNDDQNQIYIEGAIAYEYFAFRWVPGCYFLGDVLTVANTLVEFKIEKITDNKCKVMLIESGFSDLPGDTFENAHKQNSEGWDFMMGRLENLFTVS